MINNYKSSHEKFKKLKALKRRFLSYILLCDDGSFIHRMDSRNLTKNCTHNSEWCKYTNYTCSGRFSVLRELIITG